MKKRYGLCCLAFFTLGFSQIVFADFDVIQAEKLYRRSCATCHGKVADKPALGKSRIINQMNSDEIVISLTDRKNGKVEGAGNMAKQRLSDEDIKVLSEYLPSLKK